MKIILFLLIGINSNIYSQIIDIQDKDGNRDTNTYYKDVNNLLNPYEGTYIYTNGKSSAVALAAYKFVAFSQYITLCNGHYQIGSICGALYCCARWLTKNTRKHYINFNLGGASIASKRLATRDFSGARRCAV